MCLLHLPRQHSQFLWFLRRRFSWLFLITITIRERTRKYLFHSVCFNNLRAANLIKFFVLFLLPRQSLFHVSRSIPYP